MAQSTRPITLISALVSSDERRETARQLAQHLGAEDLLVFIRDPEINILLPAPGFIQTLPTAEAQSRALAETLDTTRSDLERALRAAEAASRAKDDFLATVSHELRTPLTPILGFARMLRTRALDATTTERALAAIERNAELQAHLIEDILDFARIIAGKLRLDVQPIDPAVVVEAAVDVVRPAAAAKEVRLHSVLDPSAGPVAGDASRLQQVIWNLLTNAVKFTPKGGRVQVRLERINSHIEITVSDTGEGISPDFLPFVFERFRQADTSISRRHDGLGLGLGLSIVRRLLEMHGGTVTVASGGLEQGSTFTVKLPRMIVHDPNLLKEDPARRHPTAAEQQRDVPFKCPPELAGLRVLVVDDEADARDMLAVVLRSCGSEATTAAGAADGLAALQRLKPDLLVSDIEMPDPVIKCTWRSRSSPPNWSS